MGQMSSGCSMNMAVGNLKKSRLRTKRMRMKSGTTMRKTTTTMREKRIIEGIAMKTSGRTGCMIEDDSGANKSEEREMIRKTWWAMDTEISLYLPRRHLSLFPIVLNLFKRNEQRFSRFITESELMRLNQSSSAWVRVSIPLFRLLFLAHHYWEQTKGLFSPYEYEALVAAGYDRSFPLLSEENVRFHHAKEETVVDPKSRDGVPLLLDRHRLRVKKAKGIKIKGDQNRSGRHCKELDGHGGGQIFKGRGC